MEHQSSSFARAYRSRILFLYSNFSLPQSYVLKLIHNAYYIQSSVKFKFGWRNFHCSRVTPLQLFLLNNETTQTPKISNDYIQKQCRQVSKNEKVINMNSGTLTLPQTSEGICVHWIHSLFISTFFMDFRGNYCWRFKPNYKKRCLP